MAVRIVDHRTDTVSVRGHGEVRTTIHREADKIVVARHRDKRVMGWFWRGKRWVKYS